MDSRAFQPGPFHPSRPELIAPVRIDPRGVTGPTRRQARGKAWRRTGQGLYVPSSTSLSLDQRVVEAAAALPPSGAVTGWAGLWWSGGSWFEGSSSDGTHELPVALASCSRDIRPQPGAVLTQERLNPRDVVVVDGLFITRPVRSVCFEMRYAEDEREATVFLDMAAYSDVVSVDDVLVYLPYLNGWTGVPQLRLAVVLADENSWSPWETRLRLVWVLDAGFPRPLCNRPIFDLRGRHIGTPDLFDPETGTVGEFEGGLHLTGRRRSKDLRRESLFRSHGLEYFAVVARDFTDRDELVQRMQETRQRAIRNAPAHRAWTLTPPRWWRESHTVEQRRALTGRAREVILGHRQRLG